MAPRVDKYGVPSYAFNFAAWLLFGSLGSGVYMFSLPWITTDPANTAVYRPRFNSQTALSGLISTTTGTGAMACTWLFSMALAWSDEAARVSIVYASRGVRLAYYGTLFVFTLGFSLFLAFPTSASVSAHVGATFLFAFAAIGHNLVILTRDRVARPERFVLITAMPFNVIAAFCSIYQAVTGLKVPPYVYWGSEVIALFIMSFFTFVHVFFGSPDKRSTGLTERRIAEFGKVFDQLDHNKTGFISSKELKTALGTAGVNTNDVTVLRDDFGTIDLDGDGRISFSEFVEYQRAALLEHGDLLLRPAHRTTSGAGAGVRVE